MGNLQERPNSCNDTHASWCAFITKSCSIEALLVALALWRQYSPIARAAAVSTTNQAGQPSQVPKTMSSSTTTAPPGFTNPRPTSLVDSMLASDAHRQLAHKLAGSSKASQAVDDSVLDAVLKASDLSKRVNISSLQRARWVSTVATGERCPRDTEFAHGTVQSQVHSKSAQPAPAVLRAAAPSMPAPEGMFRRDKMVQKYLSRGAQQRHQSPHPSRFAHLSSSTAAATAAAGNGSRAASTPTAEWHARQTPSGGTKRAYATPSDPETPSSAGKPPLVSHAASINLAVSSGWGPSDALTAAADGMYYAGGGPKRQARHAPPKPQSPALDHIARRLPFAAAVASPPAHPPPSVPQASWTSIIAASKAQARNTRPRQGKRRTSFSAGSFIARKHAKRKARREAAADKRQAKMRAAAADEEHRHEQEEQAQIRDAVRRSMNESTKRQRCEHVLDLTADSDGSEHSDSASTSDASCADSCSGASKAKVAAAAALARPVRRLRCLQDLIGTVSPTSNGHGTSSSPKPTSSSDPAKRSSNPPARQRNVVDLTRLLAGDDSSDSE